MKKLLALLIASAILTSLCSCNNKQENTEAPVTLPPVTDENIPDQIAPDDLTGKWETVFTWDDIIGSGEDTDTPSLEQAEMTVILSKLDTDVFSTVTIEFGEYYRGRMYVNEEVTKEFAEKLKEAYLDYYTSSEYTSVMLGMTIEEFEAQIAAEGKSMEDYRQEMSAAIDENSAISDLTELMKDKKYNYDFAYSILDNQVILTVIDKEMAEAGEALTKTLTISDDKLILSNDEGDDILFEKK